jgi:hypothetical protein
VGSFGILDADQVLISSPTVSFLAAKRS